MSDFRIERVNTTDDEGVLVLTESIQGRKDTHELLMANRHARHRPAQSSLMLHVNRRQRRRAVQRAAAYDEKANQELGDSYTASATKPKKE